MKLEDQVTNLELSKKLKELGVKQESEFWWRNEYKEKFMPRMGRQWVVSHGRYIHVDSSYEEDNVSAFTVAELGEMLPKYIQDGDTYAFLQLPNSDGDLWVVEYYNFSKRMGLNGHHEHADTEADARAKMLIYLIENKLIALL